MLESFGILYMVRAVVKQMLYGPVYISHLLPAITEDLVPWHNQSCVPFGGQVDRNQNWIHLRPALMSQGITAAYSFSTVKGILANDSQL